MTSPASQIVYHADCRSIPVESLAGVHTLITDPPYSEYVHANAASCGSKALGKPGNGRQGVRDRDLGFVAIDDELRTYIARAAAAVKRWGVVYSDVESAHVWREACTGAGATYIRPTAWIRWSQPQLSGDRPPTGFEILSVFWGSDRGAKSWNGRGNLIEWAHEDPRDEAEAWYLQEFDAVRHKALRGSGKHRTEKPLDQALDLVCYFSDPGHTVYDPCSGAGTTGVACALLDRSFVGCELDGYWAEFAQGRISLANDSPADLSERDRERVARWLESVLEAADVKEPTREAERPAYERAQRRLADAVRVAEKVGMA